MTHSLRVSQWWPARTPLATDAMWQRHLECLASLHPLMQLALAGLQRFAGTEDRVWLYCYWGFRGRKDQEAARAAGTSRARFGQSWHNVWPALAMDIWPIYERGNVDWKSREAASLLRELAEVTEGILTWGGHWKRPHDLPHFQWRTPHSRPADALAENLDRWELVHRLRPLEPGAKEV